MNYSTNEVMQYVAEEDVKFIRLAFCDVFGVQKNISIMPDELPRAFEYGIAIDASAISGFGDEARSDLFLHPEPETLTPLPWRPDHGRVVRMFCSITRPDGEPFKCDTRKMLRDAAEEAVREGVSFYFGAEQEFYLFELDEFGERTNKPYDRAGYMDIAPEDKGENIRREVCLTLEQMGIRPESSHHEEGPGQNEIAFRYSDALTAADQAMTFRTVVKTIAGRNGLYADFSPKPLKGMPGNGFHVNLSVRSDGRDVMGSAIAGILNRAVEMTAFLNPTEDSYLRLGQMKAPGYVSWSPQNRSQLVRVPYAEGEYRRAELRSPDPAANPYLAFALLIRAGLEGIRSGAELPPPVDANLYSADSASLDGIAKLPRSFTEAKTAAAESDFIKAHVPEQVAELYCG